MRSESLAQESLLFSPALLDHTTADREGPCVLDDTGYILAISLLDYVRIDHKDSCLLDAFLASCSPGLLDCSRADEDSVRSY